MKESTQTEMLTVSRKRVQDLYEAMLSEQERKDLELYNQVSAEDRAAMLYNLFGSKCLTDVPKPTEPKGSNSFQNGNTCPEGTYPTRHVPENEKSGTCPNYSKKLNGSDHLPDPTKMVDGILCKGFSSSRRLNIAATIVPGILAAQGNGPADKIAADALAIADALIKLSEKTNP